MNNDTTYKMKFDLNRFCGKNCIGVQYKKLVTGGNDPTITKRMNCVNNIRYSKYNCFHYKTKNNISGNITFC
jgi:hypothetical protein